MSSAIRTIPLCSRLHATLVAARSRSAIGFGSAVKGATLRNAPVSLGLLESRKKPRLDLSLSLSLIASTPSDLAGEHPVVWVTSTSLSYYLVSVRLQKIIHYYTATFGHKQRKHAITEQHLVKGKLNIYNEDIR